VPHASLKLRPALDTNETPALNEAGISTCNLIRLFYDRNGLGLCQKLGGWTRYYPNTLTAIPRALLAWEDNAKSGHLAVGTENIGDTFEAQLGVITDGVLHDITPRSSTDNITATVSSTAGSSYVTITDATITDITRYDAVYIPAHIAIGGVVLFGLYPCNPDGHSATTTYTVQALDALGAALAATSSSSSPTVALFSTVDTSTEVTVTLAGHGYIVGRHLSGAHPDDGGRGELLRRIRGADRRRRQQLHDHRPTSATRDHHGLDQRREGAIRLQLRHRRDPGRHGVRRRRLRPRRLRLGHRDYALARQPDPGRRLDPR
jgi:hypothetical protein